MNPMTNVKNITKLNEKELALGVTSKTSWHNQYKDSAWVFIGGLAYDLTEGDVICVFSQYGEVVNINLVRDKKTGKSKGYCFLCYEDQKSTILAVDNFNGIKLLGRTIRVDHVADYKPPKNKDDDDPLTKYLHSEGCAPEVMTSLPLKENKEEIKTEKSVDKKHSKKTKKKKKKKKHKSTTGSDSDVDQGRKKPKVTIKQEKSDPGYEKYEGIQQVQGAKKSKWNESGNKNSAGSSQDNNDKRQKLEAMKLENKKCGKRGLSESPERTGRKVKRMPRPKNKTRSRHDSSSELSISDEKYAKKKTQQSSSAEESNFSSGSKSSDSDSAGESKGTSVQEKSRSPSRSVPSYDRHRTSHDPDGSRNSLREKYVRHSKEGRYEQKVDVEDDDRQRNRDRRRDSDFTRDTRNERYQDGERDRNSRRGHEDERERRTERNYDRRENRSDKYDRDDHRTRRYEYGEERGRNDRKYNSDHRTDAQHRDEEHTRRDHGSSRKERR